MEPTDQESDLPTDAASRALEGRCFDLSSGTAACNSASDHLTIDELEPKWLKERTAQYRRQHGPWWWRRSSLFILLHLALAIFMIGVTALLVILLPYDSELVATAVFISCVGISVLYLRSGESQREAGRAMLARIRSQTEQPVLPRREEYQPSRFPDRIAPARIRERLGLPNFWIPMRHIESFRSLAVSWPYKQLVIRLAREPDYVPFLMRLLTRTVANPAVALAALASFQLLVVADVPLLALALFVLATVLLMLNTWWHLRFAQSVYAERINEDWPCLNCGYPLKNLLHTGGTIARCPECGTPLTTLDICLREHGADAIEAELRAVADA